MSQVAIQLLANSGVYIQGCGLRFLVDGIYGKNRFFSPPLKEVQKAVFGMNSPYRNVNYLLHTHRHTDHFCAAYVNEYASNNTVDGIFVPRSSPDPDSFLEDRGALPKAALLGCLREISVGPGEVCRIPLKNGCEAAYVRCRHLDGNSYASVLHCGLLLTLGPQRFLFAADADSTEENLRAFQALGPLTAVFVTPLFFLHPAGRHMLEVLRPERVVLYHLPLAEDDVTKLRPLAQRELADYGDMPFQLEALTEPNQTLLFSSASASGAELNSNDQEMLS